MATEAWTGQTCEHGYPVEFKTECPRCRAATEKDETMEDLSAEIAEEPKEYEEYEEAEIIKEPPPAPGSAERTALEAQKMEEIRKDIGGPETQEAPGEKKEKKIVFKNTVGHKLASEPHGEVSQDNFAIGDHYALVADGMGGVAGGYEASTAIVETAQQLESEINKAVQNKDRQQIENVLRRAIETSQNAVAGTGALRAGSEELGSTLTMMVDWQTSEQKGFLGIGKKEGEKKLTFANVGDSRIYRLRGDKLEQVSRDQSISQALVETGIFPDDQDVEKSLPVKEAVDLIRNKVKNEDLEKYGLKTEEGIEPKELLARLIELKSIKKGKSEISLDDLREIVLAGVTADKKALQGAEIKTVDAEPGDIYIASSDGLHDNLLDSEIEAIAGHYKNNLEKMNDMLVMAAKIRMGEMDPAKAPELQQFLKDEPKANARAKSDDITVVNKKI